MIKLINCKIDNNYQLEAVFDWDGKQKKLIISDPELVKSIPHEFIEYSKSQEVFRKLEERLLLIGMSNESCWENILDFSETGEAIADNIRDRLKEQGFTRKIFRL
jgi:hypothetical protein